MTKMTIFTPTVPIWIDPNLELKGPIAVKRPEVFDREKTRLDSLLLLADAQAAKGQMPEYTRTMGAVKELIAGFTRPYLVYPVGCQPTPSLNDDLRVDGRGVAYTLRSRLQEVN